MEKNLVYEKLNQCYESMKNKLPFKPQVALILGSGLGNYAERFQEEGGDRLPGDRRVSRLYCPGP